MIEETISKIEGVLRETDSLDAADRAELEELLAQLRREARTLPLDALPPNSPDDNLQSTVARLEQSLAGFETTHPQLTAAVNRISAILANMGI